MVKFVAPLPSPPLPQMLPQLIEPWFIFALIWSVGATCDGSGRKKFDSFLREKMKEVMCACFVCTAESPDYCVGAAICICTVPVYVFTFCVYAKYSYLIYVMMEWRAVYNNYTRTCCV